MKHVVTVTYSDPTHDFMSMKGRTKSTNYVVEARNVNEAQLRASSYFRSMGYKIHSATIVEQKKEVPAPTTLSEEVEQIDELKASTLGSYVAKSTKDEAARKKEGREVQAKFKKAGYQVGVPYDPKLHSTTASRAAGRSVAISKLTGDAKVAATVNEETQYIEEKLSASDGVDKWIHDFVHSDNPKFEGKSKKERIQQALGAYYAAKRGTNEEVEQVEEGSMSPAVKAAQAKFDAQTKAQQQKPVQAGTLAAKARREGQVAEGAEDPSNILGVIKAAAKSKTLAKQASPKIELGLSKDNPVNEKGPKDEDITEAVEGKETDGRESKTEVKGKEVKSTEKETAVAKAKDETVKKKKNPVIINPEAKHAGVGSMSINTMAVGGSSGSTGGGGYSA